MLAYRLLSNHASHLTLFFNITATRLFFRVYSYSWNFSSPSSSSSFTVQIFLSLLKSVSLSFFFPFPSLSATLLLSSFSPPWLWISLSLLSPGLCLLCLLATQPSTKVLRPSKGQVGNRAQQGSWKTPGDWMGLEGSSGFQVHFNGGWGVFIPRCSAHLSTDHRSWVISTWGPFSQNASGLARYSWPEPLIPQSHVLLEQNLSAPHPYADPSPLPASPPARQHTSQESRGTDPICLT